MSLESELLRAVVVQRADARCEYCQLPAQLQIGGFEIDHIVPRSRGGQTDLSNAALACPHCNARKWARVDGEDPNSGERVALFNPRTQTWSDHFQWSEQGAFTIVGLSDCGRATMARLLMNHPDLVNIRRLLAGLGLAWRVES
jgi:hypothetical protein